MRIIRSDGTYCSGQTPQQHVDEIDPYDGLHAPIIARSRFVERDDAESDEYCGPKDAI